MDPFKIKPGLGMACMDVACDVFGQPADTMYFGFNEKISTSWRLYEGSTETKISLEYHSDKELLTIYFEHRTNSQSRTPPASVDKLKKFVETVRKPWAEWTEGEIMEHPMWVCLYRDEGNEPTPAMENMMHMLSFNEPSNPWIRRYFRGRK